MSNPMDRGRPVARAAMFAAALALPLLAACSGGEARKERFLEKGEALMSSRNYDKARLEFRNALQIDPKDAKAQYLAGQAAEKLGEFGEAAGLYQAVITADKGNTRARADLAKLYVFGGLPDRAKALVDEGLAAAPQDPDLLTVRGAARLQRADKAGALADAEQAIRLAPGNENAAALLASLYAQAQRLPEAIGVVEKALKATPASLDLRVILAQLYLSSGQPQKAQGQLDEVVGLDPQNLAHRYRLAQYYLLQKNVDAAEATLRKAVEIKPEDVPAKLALANLVATHRSFEAGEKSLKQLIEQADGSLALRLGLGQFYETHNRPEKAIEVYRAIVADDDVGAQALTARNRIAALALKQNRPQDAAPLLEEVLKQSPRDNEALSMRAGLALARGDAPAAITDLRAVMRDQPNGQPILRTLARAYSINQEAALAEETLRQAISVNPRDIPTRLELAQLLIQGGKPDQAQPVVDQLVTDQPGNVPALEAAFRVQVARKDLAGARKSAAAIQTVNPDLPLGWYLAGLVDQAEGQLEPARRNLERAIEITPDAVEPLAALVRVDIALQQPERAVARVDAVVQRYPKNALARNLKAEVLLSLQRREPALAEFEQAIALSPQWWVPYRGAATAELAGGAARRDAAVAIYRRGIVATKGAPPLVTDLAQVFERLGQPEKAVAEYEAWLSRDARSDVAANNLAMLLVTYRNGDKSLDRALELAKRFQESPNAAFVDTYGWVRYVRGEFTEAVPALQRAVDLAPRAAVLRGHLGLALWKAGQKDAARDNLQGAVPEGADYAGIEDVRKALAELGGTAPEKGAVTGQ